MKTIYSMYDACKETSCRYGASFHINLLCLYLYWIWKKYYRGEEREEEKGNDHGENDPIKENAVFQDQLFI